MLFSPRLLRHPEAANPAARERIALAKLRIQSILDREIVAHQKTLEQKISEQGPENQRVDPHLVGLALLDLLELNRIVALLHDSTSSLPWYATPVAASGARVNERLNELAPLYSSVSGHGFGNLVGDALEIVVFKCLDRCSERNSQFAYQGCFHLNEPKNAQGRYRKTQPPKSIGRYSTTKEADFLQFGHAAGPLCIECKNYREWVYPNSQHIKDLILKATGLGAIPVLVARRIHYTAITNLLGPAGIIAHQSYFQYYPSDKADLAARAKHKRSLGFTDVTATEEPHPRTLKFFDETLPKIVGHMAERWNANKTALIEFAHDEKNLAQLYTAIGSPAGGKWNEPGENDGSDDYY